MASFPNGTQFRRGRGSGTSAFITHERLKSRDFIKGDDVYLLLTVEGMAIAWCYPSYLGPCCGISVIWQVLFVGAFTRDVGGTGPGWKFYLFIYFLVWIINNMKLIEMEGSRIKILITTTWSNREKLSAGKL